MCVVFFPHLRTNPIYGIRYFHLKGASRMAELNQQLGRVGWLHALPCLFCFSSGWAPFLTAQ